MVRPTSHMHGGHVSDSFIRCVSTDSIESVELLSRSSVLLEVESFSGEVGGGGLISPRFSIFETTD